MPTSYMDSQSTYVDKDAMIGQNAVTSTSADTITCTNEDSGRIYLCTKGSATQVATLPTIADGLNFTFICGDAAGEILVNPTGSVVFNIKASEAGAAVATAAGTGIKNTAATNIKGDRITVTAINGAWYATMQSGIWASQ